MGKNNQKIKIGIISPYRGNYNYGGCLQAYALTKFLNNMGYEAEQIDYVFKSSQNTNSLRINNMKGWLKLGPFKSIVRIIKHFVRKIKTKIFYTTSNGSLLCLRKKMFDQFLDKQIPHSSILYNNETIKDCKDYDIYITGSDQVWYYFDNNHPKTYWLDFVKENKIKIAYAASPTLDFIDKDSYQEVRASLRDYSGISIRETSGILTLKNILLEDITDVKCIKLATNIQVCLDSVFLLSVKEWTNMMSSKKIQDKYVFYYTLGDNWTIKKDALNFCKKNNFKLVCIPHVNGIKLREEFDWDNKFYDATPQDFVSLIYYSEAIFTDSFHATAFSIIFNKTCYVYNRTGNGYRASNNRMLDLLKNLKLTNSKYLNSAKLNDSLIGIVGKRTETSTYILKKNIEKSQNFLKEMIN